MNYPALMAIVFFVMFIFLFVIPPLASHFEDRMSKSVKRLVNYAGLTIVACCVSGMVGCLSPESYKVVLCLASFGMICLMSMFVILLLFVATMTEDMEREAEDDED